MPYKIKILGVLASISLTASVLLFGAFILTLFGGLSNIDQAALHDREIIKEAQAIATAERLKNSRRIDALEVRLKKLEQEPETRRGLPGD